MRRFREFLTGGRGGLVLAIGCATALSACDIYFFVCEPADREALAELPERLSETGLYADFNARELEAGVMAYRPAYELWSDGADKRRWIQLPPGTQIDTSDPNSWRFPVGTRVWKEFSRDGVPLETRLLVATGTDVRAWVGQSYVWADDNSDAIAAPLGFLGARDTSHNVPDAGECDGCHAGRESYVLGFSAIQLANTPEADEVGLAELAARNLLTDPPASMPVIPGDADEQFALGYLHANCGHCHNQSRPERNSQRCFDPKRNIDMWLAVESLASVEETPTYRTLIGEYLEPGSPGGSEMFDRVSRRGFIYQMPPLGSEQVDDDAVARLRRWIEGME